MHCATFEERSPLSYLDPRFGGVFRDAPHFQQFLLRLHSIQHRRTAMFENTVALIDFVLSIVLVATIAKWAARRTSRTSSSARFNRWQIATARLVTPRECVCV